MEKQNVLKKRWCSSTTKVRLVWSDRRKDEGFSLTILGFTHKYKNRLNTSLHESTIKPFKKLSFKKVLQLNNLKGFFVVYFCFTFIFSAWIMTVSSIKKTFKVKFLCTIEKLKNHLKYHLTFSQKCFCLLYSSYILHFFA